LEGNKKGVNEMTPIEAIYTYKKEVPFDPENPKHSKFFGSDIAIEEREVRGVLTHILPLNDSFTSRLLDGIDQDKDGRSITRYKDGIIIKQGVYVVFWADEGDYYSMMVVDYSDITTTPKIMRNYVSSHYRHED